MKRKGLPEYREEFNRAIDHAIKECSRATGITDVETVDLYLSESASIIFERISKLLAEEQRRVLIQKRLKRCTVSVQEAADLAARDAAQPEFDFFEIEQFRGVGKRITYFDPEAKIIQYVEYNRSHHWQRALSITHLNTGIAADIARRDAEIAGDKFLHPLVKKHGDLPAEELVRLWLRDKKKGRT